MAPELVGLGNERWELGALVIDLMRWECLREGAEVELTACEYRILSILIAARGQMVYRARLFEQLWDWRADRGYSRAMDMHVARIRGKLGAHAIRSMRGVGYALGCAWAPEAPA